MGLGAKDSHCSLTQARVVGEAPLYALAALSGVGSFHRARAVEQFRQQLSQRVYRVQTLLPVERHSRHHMRPSVQLSSVSGVDSKLGLTMVKPSLQSAPELPALDLPADRK